MSCHGISANLSNISGNNTKVKSVKEEQQAKVHACLWFDHKQDVEAEDGEHDDKVAYDACCVADLVDQQEPLVHPPENKCKDGEHNNETTCDSWCIADYRDQKESFVDLKWHWHNIQ